MYDFLESRPWGGMIAPNLSVKGKEMRKIRVHFRVRLFL